MYRASPTVRAESDATLRGRPKDGLGARISVMGIGQSSRTRTSAIPMGIIGFCYASTLQGLIVNPCAAYA